MSIYNREEKYLKLLMVKEYSVKELSEKLFVSEATVRRDIVALKKKDLVTSHGGIVSMKSKYADQRIPLFLRNEEFDFAKKEIAIKATSYIKNGNVLMMDASTSAHHLLAHLSAFKNILIITNGAKTAIEAASIGIKTICTGGEITMESFSYVGVDAEKLLQQYHADVAFFSCRGISDDGVITDNSILENNIRRIMIQNSKKKILLCDQSKFGKTYLNTLCHKDNLDAIITNSKRPVKN